MLNNSEDMLSLDFEVGKFKPLSVRALLNPIDSFQSFKVAQPPKWHIINCSKKTSILAEQEEPIVEFLHAKEWNHTYRSNQAKDNHGAKSSLAKTCYRTPQLQQAHRQAERRRRLEQRKLLEQLEALLPKTSQVRSKAEIVNEAAQMIQTLTERKRLLTEMCLALKESAISPLNYEGSMNSDWQ